MPLFDPAKMMRTKANIKSHLKIDLKGHQEQKPKSRNILLVEQLFF